MFSNSDNEELFYVHESLFIVYPVYIQYILHGSPIFSTPLLVLKSKLALVQ